LLITYCHSFPNFFESASTLPRKSGSSIHLLIPYDSYEVLKSKNHRRFHGSGHNLNMAKKEIALSFEFLLSCYQSSANSADADF